MIFDQNVPDADRERIRRALDDICVYGDGFHRFLAGFIQKTDVKVRLDLSEEPIGSGHVHLVGQRAAGRAVARGIPDAITAAALVRLNIARKTIDAGGQRGIEGTLVHEGKHALDFALMLSTVSKGAEAVKFDPTAYQRELSAHLAAAFYLRRRGGEYVEEGRALGLLARIDGSVQVDPAGIRSRLERNYGLTAAAPGKTLIDGAFSRIFRPGGKWFGFF